MKKIAVSKDSGMDSDEDEVSELPTVSGHINKKKFFMRKKAEKDDDNVSISRKNSKNLVAMSAMMSLGIFAATSKPKVI